MSSLRPHRCWRPRRNQIIACSVVAVIAFALAMDYRWPWLYRWAIYHPIDLKPFARTRVDDAENDASKIRFEGIPAGLRQYDGRHVSVDGFMIPMDQDERIARFALVPSLFSIYYPPGLCQTVVVQLPPGRSIDYRPDAIRVYGTFHTTLQTDPDDKNMVIDVLQMDRADVVPVPHFEYPSILWIMGVSGGAATISLAAFAPWRRRRRAKAGRCPRCGYDLRATPDGCPECGRQTIRS